jgi:hypothetical protein
MTRFNEWRGALGSAPDYVPLTERITFILTMTRLPWPGPS